MRPRSTVGSSVTLPAAIAQANSYVVAAEAPSIPSRRSIGYVLTGSFDLKSTYYLKPRLSDYIKRTAS